MKWNEKVHACLLLSWGARLWSVDAFSLQVTDALASQRRAGVDSELEYTFATIENPSREFKTEHCKNCRSEIDPMEVPSVLVARRAFLGQVVLVSSVVFLFNGPQVVDAYPHDNKPDIDSVSQINSESLLICENSGTFATPAVDWTAIIQKASRKALGGGKAGAAAAVVQVFSLMWLRTSMNYQYRYGGTLQSSLQTLWAEGKLARLYSGVGFALVQGPLTRFGDTAANVGILALLETIPGTQEWPLPLKTACGSAAAGLWRIVLMPVDASKTAMQVEGAEGLQRLWQSAASVESGGGVGVLYRGAFAQAAATAVGHFPWFLVYNFLDNQLPVVDRSEALLLSIARSAFMGFCASCISDCSSNSLRVIKTTKQTAQLGTIDANLKGRELSYPEVVKMIIEEDGVVGLFGRGLQTRLLTNAIQGATFSVLWKFFQKTNGI